MNKTRYAILGILLEEPSTGYEIKTFMSRSTTYFWRESDSTIYPMLKLLALEGKVISALIYNGKKKKEIFSITDLGKAEFREWFKSPTGIEIPRHEFLLKLFFVNDNQEMRQLFQERLEKIRKIHKEYEGIEQRLEKLSDFSKKSVRLKALKYGLTQLKLEIHWLESEGEYDDTEIKR